MAIWLEQNAFHQAAFDIRDAIARSLPAFSSHLELVTNRPTWLFLPAGPSTAEERPKDGSMAWKATPKSAQE
jgi:hypothetical protein